MQTSISLSKIYTNDFVKQISFSVLFSFLTAVGAKFVVPLQPIPITMQTFFVLLSGVILGAKFGMLSQVFYLCFGALGLPVFAGSEVGFIKIFGPTGGYLLSFPIAAFLMGYGIQHSKNFFWILFVAFYSLLPIFFFGTLFLYTFYLHNFEDAINKGFLIFSLWDLLKLFSVSFLSYQILNRKK